MLYLRDESTGDVKIVRQGHTLALKHKRHERMQFLLDQSLGPPLHEPDMPRAQQIHCLSVRGDDKVPLDAVKAKGMHQPLSVRRFRRYWGSHIARFGENVMQHVEKRVDGTQHCCLLPPFATFFGSAFYMMIISLPSTGSRRFISRMPSEQQEEKSPLRLMYKTSLVSKRQWLSTQPLLQLFVLELIYLRIVFHGAVPAPTPGMKAIFSKY